MYNEWLSSNNIKKYIYNNRWNFLIGSFIIFLIYGSELYTITPRVDTEAFINQPNSTYNWIDIGRHGAIFSLYLLEGINFNPYYVTIISFVILTIAMIAFGYMILEAVATAGIS